MAATAQSAIAVIGIDIGKNSFHVVGLDGRGAIVLRQKWPRGQVEARYLGRSAKVPEGDVWQCSKNRSLPGRPLQNRTVVQWDIRRRPQARTVPPVSHLSAVW